MSILASLYSWFVEHALAAPHGLTARIAELFPTGFFRLYHRIGSIIVIDRQNNTTETQRHRGDERDVRVTGGVSTVRQSRPLWNGHRGWITLSFDCDYSTDTLAIPRLLEILSDYPFKTAFACIGLLVEREPDVYRQIVLEGHEIVNHTYTHPDNKEFNPNCRFNEMSFVDQEEEIRKCHEVCTDLLGYSPVGFRIPHFVRLFDPCIYEELHCLGYLYSSSTLSARVPGYGIPFLTERGIVEFPISVCPRHPLDCCFDTSHLFRNSNRAWSHTEEEFVILFEFMLEVAARYGTYINFYFDPADIVNVRTFRQVLDLLNERRHELRVATYRQLLDGPGTRDE